MKLVELYHLLYEFVVPAIKTVDGKVLIGEKGQMHLHVYEKHKPELKNTKFTSGFYDSNTKKFLTRDEALAIHGFSRSEHSPEFRKTHGDVADYLWPMRK